MHKNAATSYDGSLPDILRHSPTRVVFGANSLAKVGEIAAKEGATHALLVSDPGIVATGHVARAVKSLQRANVNVTVFDGAAENPTTKHVEAGVAVTQDAATSNQPIDMLIGLGGGSSMDCAKGINFLHTNGGTMSDYWGVGKATKPMLPMIAIPTTAGTGSEAQSFALISDPDTHQKMACGDKKAACRVAILDPDLTRTQPPIVAAMTGIDAISHAVETAGTKNQNEVSLELSRQAWVRLDRAFASAMADPNDDDARADMLIGAHLAGAAIEQSMLGAAHACANPLTARFDLPHGAAIAIMLPHVVRFNATRCQNPDQQNSDPKNPYASIADDPNQLADRLVELRQATALKGCLAECGVPESSLADLAIEAAKQWTAGFNPVTLTPADLEEVYRSAL
jgi:alcohol dehydrogenase class IV